MYLDVISLLNFSFHLFLLLLTPFILKPQLKKTPYILPPLIPSTILLFLFTPFPIIISHPLPKLLFSLFILLRAVPFQRFPSFFQNLFPFYFLVIILFFSRIRNSNFHSPHLDKIHLR
ncbi:sigma-E processing peptidase SpoIIGA, partial [Bacillus altitudinis]|uniref:sigma-E processing peptidase SpoIIGA n=1 Tax=Bacillus altitudinis TaxID=293387 RepID=UPI0016437BFE